MQRPPQRRRRTGGTGPPGPDCVPRTGTRFALKDTGGREGKGEETNCDSGEGAGGLSLRRRPAESPSARRLLLERQGDSSWWCEARSGRKTGQRSRVCSRHRVSGGLGRNEAEQGGGRGRRTPAFRCNHRGRAPPRLRLTWAPLTWAPLTWAQRNQAKPHASGEGVGNTADQPDLTHACRTRRPTQQNSRSLKGAGTLSVTGHTDAGKQVSRGFRGMKPREARPLNAASSGKNQQ